MKFLVEYATRFFRPRIIPAWSIIRDVVLASERAQKNLSYQAFQEILSFPFFTLELYPEMGREGTMGTKLRKVCNIARKSKLFFS